MIERKIKIPTNRYYVEPIRFVYGTNTVPIKLIIEDLTIVSGSSVKFYSLTENGNRFEQAGTISANEVMFTPPSGFFEVGKNKLQCEITKGSSLTYSFVIDVVCKENIMYEGTHADAIQVKSYSERAVEVAESIPADYTEMSTALNDFGIVPIAWESGGISLTTGGNYADNRKVRSKNYTSVRSGDFIQIIIRNTAYANVIMYNNDKSFNKQVIANKTIRIVIPEGVSFIRIQLRDNDSTIVIPLDYIENISVMKKGVFFEYIDNKDAANAVISATDNTKAIRFGQNSEGIWGYIPEDGDSVIPFDNGGGDGKIEYSTEEKVIGTWIDGSFVYRKCFVLESQVILNAGSYTRIFDASEMQMVIDWKIVSIDKTIRTGMYNSPSDKGAFAIGYNVDYPLPVGSVVIVEYTKG